MKKLVGIMAVVVSLTTVINVGPVLAAGSNSGNEPEYGSFEYGENLETGSLPATEGRMQAPAADPKADEAAPRVNVGGLSYRVGIDTP